MRMRLKPIYVASLAGLLSLSLTMIAAAQQTGQTTPGAKQTTPGANQTTPGATQTPTAQDPKSTPGAQDSRRGEGGQPSKQALPATKDTGAAPRTDNQQTTPGASTQREADAQRGTRDTRGTGTGSASRRSDFGLQLRIDNNRLLIGSLRQDSLFARAGFRQGDQIVSIDGQTFTTEAEFHRFLAQQTGRIPVIVLRDGERQTLHVTLDEDRAYEDTQNKGALGIWFHAYDQGCWIVDVVPGSPAEQAGLRRGDWIVKLNGHAANNWEMLVGEIQQMGPGKSVELELARGQSARPMKVQLGDQQEVFANAREPHYTQENQAYAFDRNMESQRSSGASRGQFWRGTEQRAARVDVEDMGRIADLERRIQQLEAEVAALRGQRGQSETAPKTPPPTTPRKSNAERTPEY